MSAGRAVAADKHGESHLLKDGRRAAIPGRTAARVDNVPARSRAAKTGCANPVEVTRARKETCNSRRYYRSI